MDSKLLADLHTSATKTSTVQQVHPNDAAIVTQKLAEQYLRDPSVILWWTSLKDEQRCFCVRYEDNDGLKILRGAIDGETFIHLIATDDDQLTTEAVFHGRADEILEVIADQRYFEYMLSAPDQSWLIFDTHHNELLFCGTIAETAQQSIDRVHPIDANQ